MENDMYTLSDVAKKGATLFPEKVAMVFGDTRIRYRELNARVSRFANALIGLGCKKGDRLTILSENTYKYMEAYFAAARAGMSVTPLNFRLSDSELVHIVNDSEANVFLVGNGYEERAYALKNDFKNIKKWISLDNGKDGYLSYESLIEESPADDPCIHVYENDMAILMYTGGTTGPSQRRHAVTSEPANRSLWSDQSAIHSAIAILNATSCHYSIFRCGLSCAC